MTDHADTLRRAADELEQAAEKANTEESRRPYGDPKIAPVPKSEWGVLMDDYVGGDPGAYIALVDPTVGKALAAWLRTAGADWWAHGGPHCADGCMECDDDLVGPHLRRALAVARALLREADDA